MRQSSRQPGKQPGLPSNLIPFKARKGAETDWVRITYHSGIIITLMVAVVMLRFL